MVNIIDLKFQGFSHAIAAFLIESGDGPVLVETGPHSTFKQLEGGLQQLGYQPADIKHVLLTHIHFDHAGAAWALASQGAKVYLHPLGARHMEDPSKLYQSAKRIYQDKMDSLWGQLHPIKKDHLFQMPDQERLQIGGLEFIAHYTPGHAVHHIAWQLEDMLFAGDIAGVKLNDGPIVPPCPPPDINLEDWKHSINLIKKLNLRSLFLTHFGEYQDVDSHLDQLEACLEKWAFWIKERWEAKLPMEEITPAFQEFVNQDLASQGVDKNAIDRYNVANPAWMSVAGLLRYWTKKLEQA